MMSFDLYNLGVLLTDGALHTERLHVPMASTDKAGVKF